MRAFIVLATIAFTHGAKLERAYLPPSSAGTAGGSGNFLQTPASGPFSQSNDYSHSGNGIAQNGAAYNNVNYYANQGRAERPRAAFERNAAILRQDNNNNGETYSYAYETENGIYAEESGVATNGVQAQGGYSYTGDDGRVYSVRYTADQNGFVPQGDHLPTPPPIPEEILKALEQNARDEAAGIYDDGSYNDGKYGAPNAQYLPPANAARTVAPTYGAPTAPAFNVAGNRNSPFNGNAPSFNGNAPSFNGNVPSFNGNVHNSGVSRNSAAEKAYLPPFANQRGQARNTFGSRQQSFNSRTGYNY